MEKYDLVILGGGAAAFAAAIKANALGFKAAMINDGLPLGGTCVNVGCVPSKHLLEVGKEYYYPNHVRFKSVKNQKGSFDFNMAIKEKDELIETLRRKNYVNVEEGLENVTLYEGHGRFISKNEIEIDGNVISGEKFLIATGSRATILPFKGVENVDYITNKEALSLEELPQSMIIIGAGPLGLEFAQMYRHFGTNVVVLQRSARILSKEEPEVSDELMRCLLDEGIDIHTNVNVESIEKDGSLKVVNAKVNGKDMTFTGEQLLLATGVTPNAENLGLEKTGVEVERGRIKVDERLCTTAPHIFAAGDVIGGPFLETVAAKEGSITAENALKGTRKGLDYDSIPHAVFTDPQVASVGLTEEEHSRRYNVCSCRTVNMAQLPKAQAVNDTRGVIKMVIHPQTETIVGVHIVSPTAADIIHEAVMAVKFKLTLEDVIDTVHVFPTFSESIKLVAQAFKRDISKMSCCVE